MKPETYAAIGLGAAGILILVTKGKIFGSLGAIADLGEEAAEGAAILIEAGVSQVEITATWLGQQVYINAKGNSDAIAQMQERGLYAGNLINLIVSIENGGYAWVPQRFRDMITYDRGIEIFSDAARDLALQGGTRWVGLQNWNTQQSLIMLAAKNEAAE